MEDFKPNEITDTELVMALIRHIEEPCGDGNGNNARDVYLKEAKMILPTIKNSGLKMLLEDTIENTKSRIN